MPEGFEIESATGGARAIGPKADDGKRLLTLHLNGKTLGEHVSTSR